VLEELEVLAAVDAVVEQIALRVLIAQKEQIAQPVQIARKVRTNLRLLNLRLQNVQPLPEIPLKHQKVDRPKVQPRQTMRQSRLLPQVFLSNEV
jgi:hypothetical protein